MTHPETNGGRLVKRGDRFDPECSRTSARLSSAHQILKSLRIEPTWNHSDFTSVEYGREKHVCDSFCYCEWPEWVPGETFDLAYRMADLVATERGAQARAGRSV